MKNDYLENDGIDIPETDFSEAIPYSRFKETKKQVTIRLKPATIYYFTQLSEKTGIPYQRLINMYLDDCAEKKLEPRITWE